VAEILAGVKVATTVGADVAVGRSIRVSVIVGITAGVAETQAVSIRIKNRVRARKRDNGFIVGNSIEKETFEVKK
jgi:acyl-CoA hydrolase